MRVRTTTSPAVSTQELLARIRAVLRRRAPGQVNDSDDW